MSLPVSPEYLLNALKDGHQIEKMTLLHRQIGNLSLPTGRLCACDPLVCPETEPFEILLPKGDFPVSLSVAQISTDQRVAFAVIRFKAGEPVAWDMLTTEGQDPTTLEDGHFFGYGVDSGTGCFMDQKAGKALLAKMTENTGFFEVISAELEKTYVYTWSWMNMSFEDAGCNLIAFSTGYGDGAYASYVGFDEDGDVLVVVTDFGILPQT